MVSAGPRPLHRSKVPARAKLLATAGVSLATGALSGADPAVRQNSEEIVPFVYHAPQSALDDLKQRLKQTRWPEHETTNDWSEGVPLEKLRALVEYLAHRLRLATLRGSVKSFPTVPHQDR